MHPTYDLYALPLPTVPPSRSDTEHSLRIAALLTHLGVTGSARIDIMQLVDAHGDAMVRREVLRAGDTP